MGEGAAVFIFLLLLITPARAAKILLFLLSDCFGPKRQCNKINHGTGPGAAQIIQGPPFTSYKYAIKICRHMCVWAALGHGVFNDRRRYILITFRFIAPLRVHFTTLCCTHIQKERKIIIAQRRALRWEREKERVQPHFVYASMCVRAVVVIQ